MRIMKNSGKHFLSYSVDGSVHYTILGYIKRKNPKARIIIFLQIRNIKLYSWSRSKETAEAMGYHIKENLEGPFDK